MSENIRIMPMQNPLPLWDEHSYSEYPDVLKMAFRNGQVRTYRLEVEQPKPHTVSGYRGKHEKTGERCEHSTGQRD